MKLPTLMSAAVLLCAGYALAGPGSGEPRSPTDPPSGRPAEILDETKCADVWGNAEKEGDTLSKGQAAPYVVNFDQVDADDDGKISESEFKDGCNKGLIQQAAVPQQPTGKAVPMAPAGEQELPASPQ